ncbi:unnamed protein product [Bathycoccus prasinos]
MFTTVEFLSNGAAKNCSSGKQIGREQKKSFVDLKSDDYEEQRISIFVSPTGWERTVIVEEVLYTFGLVVLVRFLYGLIVPRRFGGFV